MTASRVRTAAAGDRVPKRKVSVSLDEDIVEEFEREGPLSAQINAVLEAELARRRQRAALDALVEELVVRYDGLDSDEDRAAIARYEDLLS